ncbi:MAG TPA: phage holin family protein [Armatimonadota bacterium]
MKGLLLRWLCSVVALWITVKLGQLLGFDMELKAVGGAVIAVVMLAFLNTFVRPIILLLTLPLSCLTFGLFGFLLNALLFLLVGSGVVEGFRVHGFLAALFGSIVMGLTSGLLNQVITTRD